MRRAISGTASDSIGKEQLVDFESTFQHGNFDDGTNARYWDTVKRKGHRYPEQDLMLAVLKDALLNYRKRLRNPKKKLSDDREWFFASDREGVFSFESVCALLALNAPNIRKRLRVWEREAAARSALDSQ